MVSSSQGIGEPIAEAHCSMSQRRSVACSRRRPKSGLIVSRQIRAEPFGRNGFVVRLLARSLIQDAARSGELDGETGIVLEVNDPAFARAARRLLDRRFSDQKIAKLMNLILSHHALLD